MSAFDRDYKNLLREIVTLGHTVDDRTGVGTRKIFDANLKVDLSSEVEGIYHLPALTLRKVFPRVAFEEMKWMLSGSTDAKILQDKNIKIWDGNTSREFLDKAGLSHLEEGQIGRGYGYQFRSFNGEYDQLKEVLCEIDRNPHGRRHYISLWNPCDLKETALPPCHLSYQFVVTGEELNLKFYMRSCDVILGLPTNMMFSGFFLTFVANLLGYRVGSLAVSIGDAHVYLNHLEAANYMINARDDYSLPEFTWIEPYSFDATHLDDDIDTLLWEDVNVIYDSNEKLPRELLQMAV